MRGMKLQRILHIDSASRPTKHMVSLTPAERRMLQRLVAAGVAPARTLTHARIMLKADSAPDGPGWTDEQIRAALDVSLSTIVRVRRMCGQQGLDRALH